MRLTPFAPLLLVACTDGEPALVKDQPTERDRGTECLSEVSEKVRQTLPSVTCVERDMTLSCEAVDPWAFAEVRLDTGGRGATVVYTPSATVQRRTEGLNTFGLGNDGECQDLQTRVTRVLADQLADRDIQGMLAAEQSLQASAVFNAKPVSPQDAGELYGYKGIGGNIMFSRSVKGLLPGSQKLAIACYIPANLVVSCGGETWRNEKNGGGIDCEQADIDACAAKGTLQEVLGRLPELATCVKTTNDRKSSAAVWAIGTCSEQ
ncbi:MAG: hypothetical protein AAB383_03100 [Patescibacteria group bacterium]